MSEVYNGGFIDTDQLPVLPLPTFYLLTKYISQLLYEVHSPPFSTTPREDQLRGKSDLPMRRFWLCLFLALALARAREDDDVIDYCGNPVLSS